ncbi:MAG: hypothetical protein IT304_08570 [Dehalococcoidia bacterium]|nr:hypothetical protein [Dehalococcoidia bacterium]
MTGSLHSVVKERERVVFPKDWTFDLAEEMVEAIGEEFSPSAAVEELARRVAGKPHAEGVATAEAYFEDYGRRWMGRTLELGEQYRDRTYEVLLQAAETTGGDLAFPHVPERFVEIAYLSTQPLYSLPIVENTRHRFTFKMVFCDTFKALEDQCGPEMAATLPCRKACLAAVGRAFRDKGFDVEVVQDSSLATDEFCQFRTERRAAANGA